MINAAGQSTRRIDIVYGILPELHRAVQNQVLSSTELAAFDNELAADAHS